jgi:DNA-binding NarL/FixJ family response regulator
MLYVNGGARSVLKTVLVVDAHPIVRRGVRAFVELLDGFASGGDAASGEDALEQAELAAPDIVVMDLSMPCFTGIETIRAFRRRHPRVAIIIFTLHQSEQLLLRALGAGALAYVCKAESEHLVPALEAVSRGERYLSPGVGEILLQSADEMWDRRPLTLREQQVVRLAAEGHPNKDIARLLTISVKTTETHRSAAMRKTGTNSLAALTLYAARNGLVEV